MLTLNQLYALLDINELLLQKETQLGMEGSFQRLTELMLHRAIVKDTIIAGLEAKVKELSASQKMSA